MWDTECWNPPTFHYWWTGRDLKWFMLCFYMKCGHFIFMLVCGCVLYWWWPGVGFVRNLPRHQFGNLQAKMFPAYFKLLLVCCSACVAAMAATHPWATATKREKLQIIALGISLFTVLINLLIFQPLTVKVCHSYKWPCCLQSVARFSCFAGIVKLWPLKPNLISLTEDTSVLHEKNSLYPTSNLSLSSATLHF